MQMARGKAAQHLAVAVFLFLAFAVLGGAEPDPRTSTKIEPVSIVRQR
jgi:hypothetical protein